MNWFSGWGSWIAGKCDDLMSFVRSLGPYVSRAIPIVEFLDTYLKHELSRDPGSRTAVRDAIAAQSGCSLEEAADTANSVLSNPVAVTANEILAQVAMALLSRVLPKTVSSQEVRAAVEMAYRFYVLAKRK